MKRNVMGHMSAPEISARRVVASWHLPARLLCLLLALVIWLLIYDESRELSPDSTEIVTTVLESV